GEYLNQEFKDCLCKNGIVQHLTSPYTPQQNGVSKRRNRTLLDMERSMFNLTTLPLSFWDYALESDVHILNMVSTKKVEDDEVGDLGEPANYKAIMIDPDKMHKARCGVCTKLSQLISTESREAPLAQAEYVATSEALIEAVWIRKFVGDIGVMPSINKPINMYSGNSATIIFANEPGIMKGARHFLQRYHYVREQVKTGEIKLIKVHTYDNLADPFTKALPRGMVIDHAKGIGLQLASSFMHTCD
nr:retrovirus-related Pol polyprotein from transposon TNT 1-94 [Tanacetum cinerariifolium]